MSDSGERAGVIIRHARGWASRLVLRGAVVVDRDSLVEALEPPMAAEAELRAILEREPSDSERALWLGSWRARLREARPE